MILCCAPVFAAAPGIDAAGSADADTRTISQIVDDIRTQHHLTEYNFSISYYNTVTGERYAWNDTRMMLGASTYKLPLNLYYYQQELAGKMSPDDIVGGMKLSQAHYLSLVYSDNDVSTAMIYHLGQFGEYKRLMRTFFSMTDDEIGDSYYYDNHYCTRMMLEALQYLYENADDYSEMLGYLLEACPDAYFKRGVTEYDVAHKYGSFEGAENDVGIIYASQPFLLAVYTQDAGGEEVCAQLARLLTDYTDRQYENALAQEAQQRQQQAERDAMREARLSDAAAAKQDALDRLAAEPAQAVQASSAEAASTQPFAADDSTQPDIPDAVNQVAAVLVRNPLLWMIPLALAIALAGFSIIRPLFTHHGKYERRFKKYARFLPPEPKEHTDVSDASEDS